VLKKQIERLKKVKKERNNAKVKESLMNLEKAAQEDRNLLPYAIEAAKNRATLGEISLALEKVFGRYVAEIKIHGGLYGKIFNSEDEYEIVKNMVKKFAENEGRQPRILIAKIGQDGHDRGAKVVATGYADCGFDVDMGPLFQTPEEAAKQAVENDVHVIGISSLAAGHKTLVPQLINELKNLEEMILW